MFSRTIKESISADFGKGKAILLIGPRQVGKTTLIRELLADKLFLFLDGDDPTAQELLKRPDTKRIQNIIGTHKVVFIDEAQRFENIGITIKIIVDQLKDVQVIASGSSVLELRSLLEEPLTGRKITYRLFPISWTEYEASVGLLDAQQDLHNRLIHGMYPDIINEPKEQGKFLKELVNSYLFKDVFSLGTIQIPEALNSLLKALAYQVGQEVSYNELSRLLKIDAKTVANYIDLLEQAYIVFRLSAYSGNLRNEIRKSQKIYFYDNGVRNAIIGDLRAIQLRQDLGALWENFLVSERKKELEYGRSDAQSYFWRTTQQQEVDYVEMLHKKVYGFEFKWSPTKKIHFPKTFTQAYNTSNLGVSQDNFREFLGFKHAN